jgi:cysteine desulfurase family protein (TIGR01976 family)
MPWPLDVDALRVQFPALAAEQDGRPVAYFDGPGGTQVPQRVIDAVGAYYREANANHGGAFLTSERSDAISAAAHAALADFLGATSPEEIKLGPNMTTLTFHVSRAIAATMSAGDEIVITALDHEANRGPWEAVARDRGLLIREVDIRSNDVTLDLDAFDRALGARTRLICFGYASNAVGSINPVAELVRRAHGVGAWTYVDAVHYAPHGPIDVAALDTDFLACSVYKFFGPHQGVLYGKRERLEALPAYKLKPADDRFETGTQSFELQGGTLAAIEYLAEIGARFGDVARGGRRQQLVAGMSAIRDYEAVLFERLVDGVDRIPGVRIWGITDRSRFTDRTPTLALTIDGRRPRAAAEELGRRGFATWDGNFYAQTLIERLGLEPTGGVLRIGLVHYNTAEEVDRLLGALEAIAAGPASVG